MRSKVPSGRVRGLAPLVVAVLAAIAVLLPASAAADPTAEYFPLPEGHQIGGGITVDSSGDVWFGANGPTFADVPSLGRIVPAQTAPGTPGGISYFPTPEIPSEPCCAKQVRDVTFDPTNGGRIWFVNDTGAIGYGAPSLMSAGTSSGMQVATTPGFPDLGGIAVDSNGVAWFTENSSYNVSPFPGNRVAHTDGSLIINQYPDLWHQLGHTDESRYGAGPAGITIGKEGAPWFAESSAGLPGYRLARAANGEYEEHLLTPCEPSLPCSGSNTGTGPLSVATAPDGSIWFTNLLKNSFGKLDPASGTITQYSLAAIDGRLAGGEPRAIRSAPDGTLWLAERGFISHPSANALVRIVPTDPPTATVYELGSGNAPISIAADSSGNVWFGVADVTSAVGRLAGVVGPVPGSTPGGDSSTSTSTSTSMSTAPPPGKIVVQAGIVGTARIGETRVNGDSVSAEQICIGPPSNPCAVVYLLSAGEYTTGFPGTTPRASASRAGAGRKVRLVVVGRRSLSIPGGSSAKVVIRLNATGRKILKRDGVLHVTLHASQKLKKGKTKVLKTKKITFTAAKK